MILVSVRIKYLKTAIAILAIAVGISIIILTVFGSKLKNDSTVHLIDTNEERIAYLNKCGWLVSDKEIEVSDIIIPSVFNKVYNDYNVLQLKQGFDLSKYKGETVRKYIYEVNNYPEYTENVQANILIYNDRIIGGDISCIELNGFTHGFITKNKT